MSRTKEERQAKKATKKQRKEEDKFYDKLFNLLFPEDWETFQKIYLREDEAENRKNSEPPKITEERFRKIIEEAEEERRIWLENKRERKKQIRKKRQRKSIYKLSR